METAISVIIPVYNGEKLIDRCIKSVLSQTLRNIEVIVVNDGSDDGTLSVLESVKDDRMKIVSQTNTGQGFARNAGIEKAAGEYIAFVDADDTIEKEMLENMYERAKADKSDVVQCNIYDIYPDGSRKIQLPDENRTVTVNNRGAYTDAYFTTCIHSYEVCNKLIKRSVLEKSGIKFKDTRKYFSEDLRFNLDLLTVINKISFVKEPYYNYYQYENSHFHSDGKEQIEGVSALFADFLNNAEGDLKRAVSYTAAMVIAYTAGLCASSCPENAKKVLSGNYGRYVREALKRNCRTKHRLFLSAMCPAPVNVRLFLAKKYSGRWKR